MASKKKYSFRELQQRRRDMALRIEASRLSMKNSIRQLTNPYQSVPKLLSWQSVRTACKVATRAIYAYKMASSVLRLFRRR